MFCHNKSGFESRSSCHVGTLGKSFTRSCLWRFGVKLRHSIRAVSGVPLSNRNLKISKALLKSLAHQGTSLFMSTVTNQRGCFPKGGQEKLRSNFQNTTRRGQSSC